EHGAGGRASAGTDAMRLAGVDVGSTTVKAVLVEDGKTLWQDYQRHNTRQAEKVLEFLGRMETEAGFAVGDRVFFTGSGGRAPARWLRSSAASWSRKSWRWRPASSASTPTSASSPRSAART